MIKHGKITVDHRICIPQLYLILHLGVTLLKFWKLVYSQENDDDEANRLLKNYDDIFFTHFDTTPECKIHPDR